MGLLDSVIGALGQGGSGGGQGDVLSAVLGFLNNQPGGLPGLVARFQQGGLGDVVGSWISTGQNLPISPEQLHNVLGGDAVAGLAQQLGLSHGDAAGQLSQLLPQVVDKLTPNGQLPSGDLGSLGDIGGLLGQITGR